MVIVPDSSYAKVSYKLRESGGGEEKREKEEMVSFELPCSSRLPDTSYLYMINAK